MTYGMYSYRDVKANGFTPPMVCVNDQVAKRDFDYRLHNDKSMGFSPSDYEMYLVGSSAPPTINSGRQPSTFPVSGSKLPTKYIS